VAPAFFTTSGDGRGQIAAINQDGTINSPANPAARGSVITLFGTGQGVVPNHPADGAPAQGVLPTTGILRVVIGTDFVSDEDILYSGLAPTLISVWQVNVRIPERVAPSNQVIVAATLDSIPTNQDAAGQRITTTIAVKQ
jgi:uncharacterized protein (TIGR03437 family)